MKKSKKLAKMFLTERPEDAKIVGDPLVEAYVDRVVLSAKGLKRNFKTRERAKLFLETEANRNTEGISGFGLIELILIKAFITWVIGAILDEIFGW